MGKTCLNWQKHSMLYGKNLARTFEGIWQEHAENLSGNTVKETSAPISQTLDTFLHSMTEDSNATKMFLQPA